MQAAMTVQALLTGLPLVPVTAALQEAALTLQKVEVELLAVSDGKRVVGSISVWDLALTACAAGYDPGTTPVLNVMSCQPVLFRVDMTAAESLQLMRRKGLSAVLAYDCKDRYEGVLCLRRLLDLLDPIAPDGPEPEYVRRVRGEPL